MSHGFFDNCSHGGCGSMGPQQPNVPPEHYRPQPPQPPHQDYGDGGGDGGHTPEHRKPIRVVAQTHVYYDDGSSCTFSTPTLESYNLHPAVAKQFMVDYFNWMEAAINAGFQYPRQYKSMLVQRFANENDRQATQQVAIMPTQVMLTPSFLDNPNDSVLMSLRYPGCELRFQLPILASASLGPMPNWRTRPPGAPEPPAF